MCRDVLGIQEKVLDSLELELQSAKHEFWELNLGPLQKHQALSSLSYLCGLLLPGFNTNIKSQSPPQLSLMSYIITLPVTMPISQQSTNTYQITNKNKGTSP